MAALSAVNMSVPTKRRTVPISKTKLWISRSLSSLAVLFLVFDSTLKFFKPAPVVEAFAKLGFSMDLAVPIGVILLACTILYAIPRTAVIGAVLLTGYLGGAIVTHLRVGDPLFSHVLFPIYFATMLWGALYLRDERVRALIGPRRGGN